MPEPAAEWMRFCEKRRKVGKKTTGSNRKNRFLYDLVVFCGDNGEGNSPDE